MKTIFFISFLFISNLASAASIVVNPFEIKFLMDVDSYELDFELTMVCRYEKWEWGDSAKYEYTYKEVPLKFTKKKIKDNLWEIALINRERESLKLSGIFKSGKECQTYQNFFLVSKKYSKGWANQFHSPLRYGLFEYSRLSENKVYNENIVRDIIENKELGFVYTPHSSQVNIRLSVDGIGIEGMSSYLFGSASVNPNTGMPWPLVKKP